MVFPFTQCATPVRCVGSIDIFAESQTGREATISWHVTIDLPVPRPELAQGKLHIEVVDGP